MKRAIIHDIPQRYSEHSESWHARAMRKAKVGEYYRRPGVPDECFLRVRGGWLLCRDHYHPLPKGMES